MNLYKLRQSGGKSQLKLKELRQTNIFYVIKVKKLEKQLTDGMRNLYMSYAPKKCIANFHNQFYLHNTWYRQKNSHQMQYYLPILFHGNMQNSSIEYEITSLICK